MLKNCRSSVSDTLLYRVDHVAICDLENSPRLDLCTQIQAVIPPAVLQVSPLLSPLRKGI